MDQITEDEDIVPFNNVDNPNYTKKNEKIEQPTPKEQLDEVPNVVGTSISQAKSILSSYNLAIYYQYSDTYANGYVMTQKTENGRIVLEVSKGRNPNKNKR